MSRLMRRSLSAVAALVAIFALIATAEGRLVNPVKGKAESGTVHFAITHTVGKINVAAGDSTDTLHGAGAVVYRLAIVPNSTGAITINVKKVTTFFASGSATGSATSTLTITNTPKAGDATVTRGVLNLTKGTGGLKGHTFSGTFSGKGNVTSGLYTINYQGTYK